MLFKLKHNPERKGELLGYEWIEVLAIVPFGIKEHAEGHFFGRFEVVSHAYCNTPLGLTQIVMTDMFCDETEEYILSA